MIVFAFDFLVFFIFIIFIIYFFSLGGFHLSVSLNSHLSRLPFTSSMDNFNPLYIQPTWISNQPNVLDKSIKVILGNHSHSFNQIALQNHATDEDGCIHMKLLFSRWSRLNVRVIIVKLVATVIRWLYEKFPIFSAIWWMCVE